MSMSSKAKRRVLVVLVALGISALATGTYIYRKVQVADELAAHRAAGLEAYARQDYKLTVKELAQYLPRKAEDVECLLAYADSMRNVPQEEGKHLRHAMGLFRRVADLQPDNELAHREMMRLADMIGYVLEARQASDVILKKNPQDTESLLIKSRALVRQGNAEEAMGVLDELLTLDNRNMDAHLMRLTLVSRKDNGVEGILPQFTQYIQDHPEDPLFVALRGMAHTFNGDAASAKTDFLAAAALKPQDAKVVMLLIQGMERVGLANEAQELLLPPGSIQNLDERYAMATMSIERYLQWRKQDELKAAVEQLDLKDPKVPVRLVGMWTLHLIEQQAFDQANPLIQMLADRDYDPMAVLWGEALRAVADWRSGARNVGQAISVLTKVTGRVTREPFFHFTLGMAYAEIGDDHLAMTAFVEAAKTAPGWVEPCIRGARAAMNRSLEAESIDLCREALRRNPRNFSSLVAMAQAWGQAVQKRGTGEDNVASAKRLLELLDAIHKAVPNEPNTLGIYALLVGQHRNKDEARALLNKALAADPPLPGEVLLGLYQVSAMQSLGMESPFLELTEKVHGLTPGTAYARALDLVTQGRTEDALARLDEQIRKAPAADKLQWQVIRARLLDQLNDKRALDTWKLIGDAGQDDPNIQKTLLNSAAVWQDRDFARKSIDRLREISADEGLDWRVAEGRWLLTQDQPSEEDTKKTVQLMQYVIERAPQRTESRLLLARAYQLQSNSKGAIDELSAAVNQDADNHQIRLTLARLAYDLRDYALSKTHSLFIAQSRTALPLQRAAAAELLMRQGEITAAVSTMESIDQRGDSASMMLLLSRLYIAQGRMNEAGNLVQQLIKTSPSSDAVGLAMGFYAASGRRPQLQSLVDQLAQEDRTSPDTALLLARGYSLLDQPETAAAALRTGLAANPTQSALWLALIDLYLDQANADDFNKALKQAAAAIPDHPGVKALAQVAPIISPNIQVGAVQTLAKYLGENPGTVEPISKVITLIGDLQAQKISPEEAAIQLAQLADSNTQIEPIQVAAAQMCIGASRYSQALEIARRAADAWPLSTEPLRQITEALVLDKQWNAAIIAGTRWRERLFGSLDGPDRMIAMAHQQLGQSDRAAAILRPYIRDIRRDGKFDAGLVYLYCQAEIGADRLDQAQSLLQSLLDTWPPVTELWIELAAMNVPDHQQAAQWLVTIERKVRESRKVELQLRLAKAWHDLSMRTEQPEYLERSKELLLQLWDDDKARLQVAFWMGAVCQAGGQLDSARDWYERSLAIDAKYNLAANNLAMVLADQRNDLDRAMTLARQVVEAAPEVPQFVDTLAYVQWKQGRFDDAIKTALRAIELEPDSMSWRLRLAEIQLEAGKTDEARSTLTEIRRRVDRGSTLTREEKKTLEKLQAATLATAGV